MKKITLEFDKTLAAIAGNEFGKDTYETQVKSNIDYTVETEIIFPNEIKKIAISFIQGFTKEILSTLGVEGTQNKIKFTVSSEKLENKIWKHIG